MGDDAVRREGALPSYRGGILFLKELEYHGLPYFHQPFPALYWNPQD